MKKILKGGTIVSGTGLREADLYIDGGKISEPFGGGEVTDISGCYLFPGFIDAHTHFDLEVAGTVTADDFSSGTQAAILGGTTTVIDFATQYKGETFARAIDNWHAKADGKCSCDYGFHLAITDIAGLNGVQYAIDHGVTTFKVYMTYDTKLSDAEILLVLKELKKHGAIAGAHCEDDAIIKQLRAENAHRTDITAHADTRPPIAESAAAERFLALAKTVDTPVIIVHVSCRDTIVEINIAKNRGQIVYAETCPQYLLLGDGAYKRGDAALFVCAPPLREKRLTVAGIDTIGSDHCAFTREQKRRDSYLKIPGGLPGAEHRGLLTLSQVSETDACRLLCENPAKIYGLYPQKGVLLPGSDADITVVRKREPYHYGAGASRAGYNPFGEIPLNAGIESVFLRGEKVAENGKILSPNRGKYLKRGLTIR